MCRFYPADRPSHLFTSGRAYCPVCKGVLWLDEPAWKSAKGRCVARNQILEYHSPKPMSVGQVCVKTSKGYDVKSIVSYECFGHVLEAVFSLAVYVSFFFLEFSLIRVLDWLITLS